MTSVRLITWRKESLTSIKESIHAREIHQLRFLSIKSYTQLHLTKSTSSHAILRRSVARALASTSSIRIKRISVLEPATSYQKTWALLKSIMARLQQKSFMKLLISAHLMKTHCNTSRKILKRMLKKIMGSLRNLHWKIWSRTSGTSIWKTASPQSETISGFWTKLTNILRSSMFLIISLILSASLIIYTKKLSVTR